jgi:hypothetical protein
MQKKVKQKREKICTECFKKINISDDHFVLVGTYNREISPDDETYYHFQCWVDYFNKCVDHKMRANISYMQEKALQVFDDPKMKEFIGQIKGSENLMALVSMPINKNDRDSLKSLSNKIKDNILKNAIKRKRIKTARKNPSQKKNRKSKAWKKKR